LEENYLKIRKVANSTTLQAD